MCVCVCVCVCVGGGGITNSGTLNDRHVIYLFIVRLSQYIFIDDKIRLSHVFTRKPTSGSQMKISLRAILVLKPLDYLEPFVTENKSLRGQFSHREHNLQNSKTFFLLVRVCVCVYVLKL